MPIFEYQCQQCGHLFEVLKRSQSGSQTVTCPKCGKRDAERLLSTFMGRTGSGAGCSSSSSGVG